MDCLNERCYSPIACGTFGYCREFNFKPQMTWGEFEAMTPNQRKARARQWIAQWQRDYELALQMDAQADQDAHIRSVVDESPIDRMGKSASSSTNRNPNV